ncbi:MAG TPA: membrane lipoprotein lipid attachment site-containing protein [Chitinophagaceae bacterium]|nr:membrane lipoprotein lipid attachment site-containing protein [Chitinophagaceae bacterium]
MKKILFAVLCLFMLTGCKKTIEQIQQDLVIQAMTDGQWKITNFVNNGNNITGDFANYRFKYYSNKTVDAINNGTVEKTGNWDGNANTMTTWANFSSASYPLTLINGNWQITRNSWTYVEATQTSGTDTKNMRLDKQ